MGVDQCFKSFCDHQINMFIPFTFEYLNPDHLQKKFNLILKSLSAKGSGAFDTGAKGAFHLKRLRKRAVFMVITH